MTSPVFTGYLEDPYLDTPPDYLGGTGQDFFGMQVSRQILDFPGAQGMQTQLTIEALEEVGYQVSRTIEATEELGMQVARFINDFPGAEAMQVVRVTSMEHTVGSQVQLTVTAEKDLGMQTSRHIYDTGDMGMETTAMFTGQTHAKGMNIRRTQNFPHINCSEGAYLSDTYLTAPYLYGRTFCVHGTMQVARTIQETKELGSQVSRTIAETKELGSQVKRIVQDLKEMAMQVQRTFTSNLGMQLTKVLYNINRLRVLVDFPSRGASTVGGTNAWGNVVGTGQNWVATSTAVGDFSPFNLNTDIVEQRWQSVASVTSANLSCDTEVTQGVSIDTLAMLNHNLTSSAVITLEGADNASFSPVGETIPLTWTLENIYYVAPTFPHNQWRYWRIVISDPTNSDNYLRVGTLIFGTTVILQGECFVDEVRRRKKHFVDAVRTAGFTNASNDRALKKSISLDFRNMVYGRGNFANLIEIFDFARTSLKCLWIPDPTDPARFAVFGKLAAIPEEVHHNLGTGTDADTVDFSVEVDEAL